MAMAAASSLASQFTGLRREAPPSTVLFLQSVQSKLRHPSARCPNGRVVAMASSERMVFGYVYPAYKCYKAVEINRPEIEQLRFWCQYCILVAILSVSERVGDAFISWFPMHNEAKLALYIYLWYPKTKFWLKAAKYGQTRFFEILQCPASQSQSPQKHTAQLLQHQMA